MFRLQFVLPALAFLLIAPIARCENALLEVKLADLPGLDEKHWSAPAESDGHRYREASGAGILEVKAWWGDSPRPPKNSAYRAEIVFKDTAAAPIRVEAFGGLPGRYELHRIGGRKDGTWQTATVPIAPDMIRRVPDKDTTEIIFMAAPGESVPVESIRIVNGDPAADEARWENETRAWIARVQKEKFAKAKAPEPQNAVIPDALKQTALIPYVRSWSRVIQLRSAPQQGETGVPLKLTLARNEIEPAQFGVYANGAELKNVKVELATAGFAAADGTKLNAEFELMTGEYAVTQASKKNSAEQIFPQRFWPAFPADIASGHSQLFWLTVYADKTHPTAGVYQSAIQITADGQPAAVLPVQIEILPLDLLPMEEAGLTMGSCVAGALPEHELAALGRHNQNGINFWNSGFTPKIVRKSSAEFDLDFTITDEVMANARAAGINRFVYFLGGNPYSFPDTMNLERELYRQVFVGDKPSMEGRKEFLRKAAAAPDKMLPEVRGLYKAWVAKFMAHAKEKNWPEPILSPFDEPAKWAQAQNFTKVIYYKDKNGAERIEHPKGAKEVTELLANLEKEKIACEDLGKGGAGEWIKSHFKDACALIHEAWPATRIYGSIHHAVPGLPFLQDIEVFCTNAIHEDEQLGDKVRAAQNKTFWQYSGTTDNTEPMTGRYSFGFFFARFNSRGSLCWAYNFGSRFDTSVGSPWIYGFTTPYSVIRTPFYEGVREAWDDRRYIETLRVRAKAAGKEAEAEALLNEIFSQAVKSRTEEGRDTVDDFFAATKDPEALDRFRARIREMILNLK